MTGHAPLRGAPAPDDFIGPVEPPMIRWQRAGEPGWPFHWPEWLPPGEHAPEEYDDPLTPVPPET